MENISVYIRLKPTKDKTESNFSYDSKTITNSKTKEIFTFDSVISPTMTNKDIFEKLIKQNLTSLLKGINVSIFAYGQTSTGKTYTMKGDQKNNEGLIPLSIKEIFNSLNNKDSSITKYVVKVSYTEIYNETVNDLIDSSKKNLEIRESSLKGIFVNNLSEISVTNLEKTMQLLNKGENNRIIAETKLNEKSSRSHTIFKINIEFFLKDKNNKEKKYNSQLNLVDLAGSENVSKAKCEGMRIKEGGNINKSLLALSNVINKLSQNNKSFVNYRDSKLTRLLQTALGGNSKTTIICTMVDDNIHYSETLNTLHFGMKAKNVKTTVKVNEIINDKGKIAMENQALRNKIKMLEKLINDKKSLKDKENNNLENNGKKALSILSSGNKNEIQNNEQISNLEKEVSLLKKYLMNNEEMGSDINSIQGDWMSMQGGNDIYNNGIYNMNNNLNTSAYKPSFKQRISNLSAIRGSGSAIKSIYFNSPCMPRIHPSEINSSNLHNLENNNFRKNLSMTEMRPGPYAPKNFFHSAIRKTAPQNNNFMFGSNMKFSMPDLNNFNNLSNLNSSNFDMGNDYLMKENEELKKNIYELKKTYYEVVQSKEQQIKLLNQNHDMTLENCEKLIKEAEVNYLNLKTEYDQVIEKMKIKDNELKDLKEKNINQDSSINYYKKELNKVKDLNYASEIESKYNSLLEENIKLKQKEEEETAKLKEENDLLKKNIDMIDNKYKEKCQELNDNQKLINDAKKQHEKELQKYKIEIKNYKNSIGKGKNSKNNKGNNADNDKIKEYEDQINKLIQENNDYKNNLEKIEKTQIVEYQKLLDESFAKIAQLNKELNDSKDKNKYLEKALNIVEKTAQKEDINIRDNLIDINEDNCKQNKNKENENKKLQSTIRQNKNNYNFSSNGRGKNIDYSNAENKEFMNKKRKGMPKIYQNVINKQQMNSDITQTPNKENNNILNTEFSNFEI